MALKSGGWIMITAILISLHSVALLAITSHYTATSGRSETRAESKGTKSATPLGRSANRNVQNRANVASSGDVTSPDLRKNGSPRGPFGANGKKRGRFCVKGSVGYEYKSAEEAAWNPSKSTWEKPLRKGRVRNADVILWGKPGSKDESRQLDRGLTGQQGNYSLCFAGELPVYDVWVTYTTQSGSHWRVIDASGLTYTTETWHRANVSIDQDMGLLYVNPSQNRAWHAFDTVNKLWSSHGPSKRCWTVREDKAGVACTAISIRWYPGSTEGPHWIPGVDIISLRDEDPDSEHTTIHECGHSLMGKMYGSWPKITNCSPHYIGASTSQTCAWVEGWADAVANHILKDTAYYWPDGARYDYANSRTKPELPATCNDFTVNPYPKMCAGDSTQARVSSSLLDLWTKVDKGWNGTLILLSHYAPSTFHEYFTSRQKVGLDVSQAARTVLFSHTIEYD